ncbi:winged helix-turn-helix domain-containing protein [Pseudomonas sp. NPDC089743]|uniref:winged helix-turn-helix domain-containing protein n=1 Tax=Pseudomonas sp. NPDC089743 TaxID=3364471 RepID=UPI003810F247
MRATASNKRNLSYADLNLNPGKREASCLHTRIVMKATPFRLLSLLLSNANKIVSRQTIFEDVWGFNFDPGTKRIEVQLNYLRNVLRSLNSSTVIETHRGKGLRLHQRANNHEPSEIT